MEASPQTHLSHGFDSLRHSAAGSAAAATETAPAAGSEVDVVVAAAVSD